MFKYLKYLVLIFLLTSCTTINKTTPYGTGKDDSNTVNALPSNNSSFFSNNSTFLANEDANRYKEQGFLNTVSTNANANSCLGVAGAGLTMTPTSCIAYNAGYRSTEIGSITFPNTSTCWVAMDENTSGNNAGLPNFTRVSGTHYLTDCIDTTQPTMVSDSQLLMKVVTSGGSITTVSDFRSKATPLITTSIGTGGSLAFGSLGSGSAVCPNTVSNCSITLTSSSVTLDASPPSNSSALLIWQIKQDGVGGRIPIWSSIFQFDAGSGGGSFGTPVVPVLGINRTESILFSWNNVTSKWVFVARSGAQQVASSNQGGASSIGGPSNSTAVVTSLPANVWTSTMSDNGGFFTAQGGGVAFYSYLIGGEFTVCNTNTTTEFFSQYCQFTLTAQRVDSDHQISGNTCANIPINFVNGGIPQSIFGNFTCFINPTNTLTLVNHSYYSVETPVL